MLLFLPIVQNIVDWVMQVNALTTDHRGESIPFITVAFDLDLVMQVNLLMPNYTDESH